MITDILKACALHESNNSPSSTTIKLGTQVVGFLSILAISGSVALLSLGKRKLWQSVFESSAGGESRRSSNAEMELSDLKPSMRFSKGNHTTRLGDIAGKAPRLKKVRFAPDVIEPRSNGREYRLRCKAASMKQCLNNEFQEPKSSNLDSDGGGGSGGGGGGGGAHRTAPTKSHIPANRIALYKGLLQQSRLQHTFY